MIAFIFLIDFPFSTNIDQSHFFFLIPQENSAFVLLNTRSYPLADHGTGNPPRGPEGSANHNSGNLPGGPESLADHDTKREPLETSDSRSKEEDATSTFKVGCRRRALGTKRWLGEERDVGSRADLVEGDGARPTGALGFPGLGTCSSSSGGPDFGDGTKTCRQNMAAPASINMQKEFDCAVTHVTNKATLKHPAH